MACGPYFANKNRDMSNEIILPLDLLKRRNNSDATGFADPKQCHLIPKSINESISNMECFLLYLSIELIYGKPITIEH